MESCLIGYSGFVGSNLDRRRLFDKKYNSRNIEDIKGKNYSYVYCAGVTATKWLANKEPDSDLKGIVRLLNALREISCERFVLISTIDVYRRPEDVDEDTPIVTEGLHPYGLHRRLVETFVQERFPNHHIIRLPGLFGANLKKNVIFDFLHDNQVETVHSDAVYQFYCLDTLCRDIETVIEHGIRLANFATEPISVGEMANYAFGREFLNKPHENPARYNMKTKYGHLFGSEKPYILSKEQVLSLLKRFVGSQRVSGRL